MGSPLTTTTSHEGLSVAHHNEARSILSPEAPEPSESPALDLRKLKAGGVIKQGQKDLFSVRLRIVGGEVTSRHLSVLAEVADKYGRGRVHLTARQGVEIPHVKLEDIDAVRRELELAGLKFGACGPRVRTIVACQGSEVCRNGLADTGGMARKLDERFYGAEAPHKFKIALSGCTNNCLKAQENDFGAVAGVLPRWDESLCTYCGLCQEVCRPGALEMNGEGVTIDGASCDLCGDCTAACPTEAMAAGRKGWMVYVGGKMGRRPTLARRVPGFWTEEEVFGLLEATIGFYRERGQERERLADTLERVGFGKLLDSLKAV